MATMAKTEKRTKSITVSKHRRANIAVIAVASVAAAILIAIAVLCLVRVNPMRKLAEPEYYVLYNVNDSKPAPTNNEAQSKISVALEDMDFTVMSAILQGHWNLTYNFKRNDEKEKFEITAKAVDEIKGTGTEFMVELVYPSAKFVNGVLDESSAQSLKVDGEVVYFDRLKVLIGDTAGKVGTISLYPYLYERVHNTSDLETLSPDTYTVTGINVRADSYMAFVSLKELAESFNLTVEITPEETPDNANAE